MIICRFTSLKTAMFERGLGCGAIVQLRYCMISYHLAQLLVGSLLCLQHEPKMVSSKVFIQQHPKIHRQSITKARHCESICLSHFIQDHLQHV